MEEKKKMDPQAYLSRMHWHGDLQPTLENLNGLVYAHQTHVAFENMDPYYYKKPVSLDPADIYEKIVERKRGGYCFEMNGLFCWLLNELGYHAWTCMVKIVRPDFDGPIPAMHRGVIVELEQDLYYCDVGYGGPAPAGAVRVEDGFSVEHQGEFFRMTALDRYWWEIERNDSSGEWVPLFRFYTMPQEDVDFMTMNYFCSAAPQSIFTQMPFFNIRTKGGFNSILGEEFTYFLQGKRSVQKLANFQDLQQVGKIFFGIELPEKDGETTVE